jgi:hypothetical protein
MINKIIVGFSILTLLISAPGKKANVYDLFYVRDLIEEVGLTAPQALNHKERKIYCIEKYSRQYNIPLRIFARIPIRESHFDEKAFNKYGRARGWYQVTPVWEYALWRIDGGKLGLELNKRKNLKLYKYYYRIGYNAELGAFALSNCFRIKKGNWFNALFMYGGWYRSNANKTRGTNYVNFILNTGG